MLTSGPPKLSVRSALVATGTVAAGTSVAGPRFEGLVGRLAFDLCLGLTEDLLPALRTLTQAGEFTVSAAASLTNAEGQMLYDSPHFPEFLKPIVKPAIDFLHELREEQEVEGGVYGALLGHGVAAIHAHENGTAPSLARPFRPLH